MRVARRARWVALGKVERRRRVALLGILGKRERCPLAALVSAGVRRVELQQPVVVRPKGVRRRPVELCPLAEFPAPLRVDAWLPAASE